jgi:hypothetical protein
VQRVVPDHGFGEIEVHVAPGRVQFQPPRDHPAAGALDRTSALVDPEHVLGLRVFRLWLGRGGQVGG